jgi:hypothetical protein
MNKVLFAALMAAGILLQAGAARADVSYASFLYNGLDKNGIAIADGTYVMVADMNNNGWQGVGYLDPVSGTARNDLNWLWDSSDWIMDKGQIGVNVDGYAGDAYPFLQLASTQKPAGYNTNVNYYLLWFNKPYNAAAVGPGQNVSYGVELLGKLGTDPGDYTTFPNGGNANLKTYVSPVATPEPISCALFLLGGGVLALRRRSSKKA